VRLPPGTTGRHRLLVVLAPAVAVDRDHTTVTAARPERRHPQGNGGDMDAENNGGPSDGDGSV
jgi:hypothetical protein